MNTKTKQRLISIVLCVAMLISLMPTAVFAVESATVTTYDDLWRAFYSNDDYNITLGSDIIYTIPEGGNSELAPYQYLLNVSGTKSKTLDLNGHTLQVTNNRTNWPTQSGLFNIDDTASLTVMNGTIKLYNYNNSDRTDKGVFNARGGNLTLTNVDVVNGRNGTAVNAQGNATVNIEGGTISAFNGFAVTAVGDAWLILDKGVTLTTNTGSGLITQPADNGYGSLHSETANLTVVSAMFEAGIEVAESTINQFSASANRLVFVGSNQYNSAFATSKSGDYYWDTGATGGCALVVNDNSYSFAKNVNVISTAAKQYVTVTNGTASPNQASYGATVTITAADIPGKVFNGWTVVSGGVTLADYSAKTTTFTMGAKAVEIRANYDNVPIASAEFTVTTPVAGEQLSAATTTTEHITVSETWCVEVYDENSFSSTLPANHTFEGGHKYRVGVAFEVEQGYALDNNFSVKFVDPISSTQTPATQGATQYMWFVDYEAEINSVEITSVAATVSGVEAGATAGSTTVTTNDTTYTVSIKGWYDCDNVFAYGTSTVLQASDTFVGGKTYTVGVTFTPVGGNTLANSLTTSINGEAGKIGGWDSGSRNYFITITVPSNQPNEYIVSYNENGGSGTMVGGTVEENGKFTLENCTYIAPEGYKFKAWAIGSVNGEQKQPGEQITITGETYIYAIWEAIEYDVTVTSGTASPAKATMGTTVTLTANQAPSGQMFDKWVVNGVVVADANSTTTTFTMPAGNVTAEATYKDIPVATYTVTVTNGTAAPAGPNAAGVEVTLTAAQAPADKVFDKWVVNGVTVADANSATTTFTMPAGDVTAEATYKDIPVTNYTVTVTNGTAAPAGPNAAGVEVTLTAAQAPAGKMFDKWVVNGVTVADANSATTTFTMPAGNVTAQATYKDIPVTKYTVSFDSVGGSAVTAQTIEAGQKAVKPADPTKAGYDFKGWTLNGSAYDFNTAVNGDITLVATWEQQQIQPTDYTVTFDSNGGSAVTAQTIEAGQKAAKPADPTKAGYDFKGWTLNGSAYDFNTAVNGNITLIAAWEAQQVVPATYTVSFDANGGTGTMADVTGVSGEYTLPANGFTAPSGQQFKAWNVGGSEYAAGAAINVAADTTVKAVWKTVYTGGGYGVSASYGVTVLDCVGADVKVSDKYAYAGEKITITIVPEQGKRVDTVAVADKNGKAVEVSCTADGTYTFKMPKSKVTVQVQTVDIIRIEMAIDNPCILFNGEPFVNDVSPVLIHDRTMVPVSVITAMLGGTSEWDGTTRQVTLHLDGQTFVMTIDQVIAGFDVAPIILNSRTYVPVGYIMGVLGADVQWIGDTREVIIQK